MILLTTKIYFMRNVMKMKLDMLYNEPIIDYKNPSVPLNESAIRDYMYIIEAKLDFALSSMVSL